jgi:ATPase subunit of ABC transporter with duplicated ATPase domains
MLRQYEGTLLLVSHDRYLLDQVTNRTLEVADGRVTLFEGAYGQYQAQKAARQLTANQGRKEALPNAQRLTSNLDGNGHQTALESLLSQRPTPSVALPTGLNAHQMSKERQRAKSQAAAAEKRVEALETRLREIEAKLSRPAPTDNVVALSQEHGGVQSALAEALSAWEQAAAYAEALGAGG